MLVYLTGETWTLGEQSAAFGEEVREAMRSGVPLLLAHEMIGLGGQEARHGCEFSQMFMCDEGATPDDLIQSGIYAKIAVALKGGEWRQASMALLMQALLENVKPAEEDALYNSSSAKDDLANQMDKKAKEAVANRKKQAIKDRTEKKKSSSKEKGGETFESITAVSSKGAKPMASSLELPTDVDVCCASMTSSTSGSELPTVLEVEMTPSTSAAELSTTDRDTTTRIDPASDNQPVERPRTTDAAVEQV